MMCQKLVRDNIPAIIEKNGETCVTRKLTDKEYETALAEKLQEEVKELLEAYTAKERSVLDCAEEMADVMEVLYAMGKTCAVSKREIEQFCIHQENGINCLKVSVPLMMLGIALYSGAGMLCIIHDRVAQRKKHFHA